MKQQNCYVISSGRLSILGKPRLDLLGLDQSANWWSRVSMGADVDLWSVVRPQAKMGCHAKRAGLSTSYDYSL